ncbi:MAG: hypothetical protein AAGA72_09210 [Pseudomonadota bacterium]
MRADFRALIFGGVCALVSTLLPAAALPQLDAVFEVDRALIAPDHMRDDLFYIAPRPVEIAERPDGSPKIELRLTYYYGSQLRGDAGEKDVSWTFSVDLVRGARAPEELAEIKSALSRHLGVADIRLQALPIASTPIEIIYTPIVGDQEVTLSDAETASVPSDPDIAADAEGNSHWRTRRLTYALSPEDGQIVRSAFEADGGLISVSYAYRVYGIVADPQTGSDLNQADATSAPDDPVWLDASELIGADAFRFEVDPNAHADFLKIIDLNSRAPPGYPILSFICSDFVVQPDDWVFDAKIVQVEAQGVAGRVVRTEIEFPLEEADISLQEAKFDYAVRLDRPYRYRVIAYPVHARSFQSAWVERAQWARPVDISGMFEAGESLGPIEVGGVW